MSQTSLSKIYPAKISSKNLNLFPRTLASSFSAPRPRNQTEVRIYPFILLIPFQIHRRNLNAFKELLPTFHFLPSHTRKN